MRIDRVDLVAYGPFTGTVLALDQPGVHLVLGPNEAGKSTTLAAISDALFGIPPHTSAGFLTDMKRLEIGLRLRRSDGSVLECTRLKKAKDDLRRPDGTVMPPDELQAFLGAVDRAVFRSVYGIDHDELVEGGRELLAGRGDVGQVLFGAGTGAASLHPLLTSLERRANELFLPTGTLPAINKALKRYKAAEKATREHSLRPKHYTDLVAEITRLERAVDELRSNKSALTRERDMCRLLVAVLPNLRTRHQARSRIDTLRPTTRLLQPDLGSTLDELRSELDAAGETVARLDAEIAGLQAGIDGVTIDARLLDNRGAIDELRRGEGEYRRARDDRRKVQQSIDHALDRSRDLLRNLRPDLDISTARGALTFETVALAKVGELSGSAEKLRLAAAGAARASADAGDELRSRRGALEALGEPPDHTPLEAALRSCQAAGDLGARRERLATDVRALRDSAGSRLGELGLVGRDVAELEALAVPPLATVETFRGRFAAVDDAIARLEAQLEAHHDEGSSTQADLDALLGATDTPSEQQLADRRAARDHQWAAIRSAWFGEPFDGDPDELAATYEHSVGEADAVADRLRREADAVARRAQLEARRLELEHRIDDLTIALAALREERSDIEADWLDLWTQSRITPGTPADMTGWLATFAEIQAAARESLRLTEELADVDRAVVEHRRDLLRALSTIGVDPPADTLLATLSATAEAKLDELAERRERRRLLRADVDRLTEEAERRARENEHARAELDTWRSSWADALSAIGLSGSVTPTEAAAFLDASKELTNLLDAADKDRHRVAEMDALLRRFESDVDRVVTAAAPALATGDICARVDRLVEGLEAAVAAGQRVDVLAQQKTGLETELAQARGVVEATDERLHQLLAANGAGDEAELREAARVSDELRDAERQVADLDRAIAEQSRGRSAAELEAALDGRDEAALQASESALELELNRVDDELSARSEALGAARLALSEIDGVSMAAEDATEAQFALSELVALTQEYMGVQLAAMLLRDQIAAFREVHQAPILDRAGPWFARLTCGAFSTIDTDLDDKGSTVIEGIRADGERVRVEGMSKGTCDQLYLALRLAALAEAATVQEPLPLVLDDLLITFDDDRARATFEILGELSDELQVIVFTHHHHLREVATGALGENLACHVLEPRMHIGG